MSSHTWWYLSRASGFVSWACLVASCSLGILLATRVLKPHDRPAWLLSLHRHLAVIFAVMLAIHLAGLYMDTFVGFSLMELFVPGRSAWKTVGVAFGVVAMYLTLVVEATSLVMRKLPRKLWRALHMFSYVSLVLVAVHALQVGSDARTQVFALAGTSVAAVFLLLVGVRLLYLREPRQKDRIGAPVKRETASDETFV